MPDSIIFKCPVNAFFGIRIPVDQYITKSTSSLIHIYPLKIKLPGSVLNPIYFNFEDGCPERQALQPNLRHDFSFNIFMNMLDQNWVTDSPLDFEYKKYLLLAYLQQCKSHFDETKLYPPLGHLMQHYRNLHELKSNIDQMQAAFPKELSGLDLKNLTLHFENSIKSDEQFLTITELMDFAIPTMKSTLEDGQQLFDLVEKNIELAPVGIMPVYNHDGYVFIHENHTEDVHIYQYHYSIIHAADEKYRSLSMNYLYRETRSISNSIENIKLKLIRLYKDLPQPATFLCQSKLYFPLIETLVPVTRRLMMKSLSIL